MSGLNGTSHHTPSNHPTNNAYTSSQPKGIRAVAAHFTYFKELYAVLFVVGSAFWGVTVLAGQNWLVTQIDKRIDGKLTAVNREIKEIRTQVRCEGISNRVAALRTELRAVETDLFKATQDKNSQLIVRLRDRRGVISSMLDDELEKRSMVGCIIND